MLAILCVLSKEKCVLSKEPCIRTPYNSFNTYTYMLAILTPDECIPIFVFWVSEYKDI